MQFLFINILECKKKIDAICAITAFYTVVYGFNEHIGQPWTKFITYPPFIIIIIIMPINIIVIIVELIFEELYISPWNLCLKSVNKNKVVDASKVLLKMC